MGIIGPPFRNPKERVFLLQKIRIKEVINMPSVLGMKVHFIADQNPRQAEKLLFSLGMLNRTKGEGKCALISHTYLFREYLDRGGTGLLLMEPGKEEDSYKRIGQDDEKYGPHEDKYQFIAETACGKGEKGNNHHKGSQGSGQGKPVNHPYAGGCIG
jgi:hypothetical protein